MLKRKQTVYPFELKLAVVKDICSREYGYFEIIEKYQLGDPHNRMSTIKRWERIYLEEGEEGLKKERRGRATKADNPNIGRPHKLDGQIEEDLIAENQRLRMELEYLKKLSALVVADEQKNDKKR